MLHDLRYALRLLRRAPGFTLVAVLVLALGIGANTAIFSLVTSILLQPLPLPHPEQLVDMHETEFAPGAYPLSGPDFPDWKAQSHLFADMAIANYPHSFNLSGSGDPQQVVGMPVEDNYFQLLGVKAELGRVFALGESQPGRGRVALLSHSLWESHFGGDPAVLGRTVTLNGANYAVVGVAPAGFRLNPVVGLWIPMALDASSLGERGSHSFTAFGRMKSGVTLAQAQAEISAIAGRLSKRYPDSNGDIGAKLFLLSDRLVRASQRDSLLTLMAVVGLVLLIACANVANLLLARALGREKEMSIRLALGARPGQIIRQLLTESVLLALAGAAFGAALAWLGVHAVAGMAAFPLPTFNPVQVNAVVLAFTVVLAVVCGLLFGLAPAWRLSRPRLNDQLSGAGALAGGGRRWLSDGLVVAEIALSLVLVTAAGLFLQSFLRLRSTPLGFNPAHVLTASITLPDQRYPTAAEIAPFKRALLDRLRALPGVEGAALSSELPLEGGNNGYITLRGETRERHSLVEWTRITPGYFATMRLPLLEGRGYSDADVEAYAQAMTTLYGPKPPAPGAANGMNLPVVVNQTFAAQYFRGRNPLGQQFRQGSDGPWMTIQGVAADVPVFSFDAAPMAQAYLANSAQDNVAHLVLRSPLAAGPLAADVRKVLAGLDATLPLYNVRTMDEVADQSVEAQSFQQRLVTGFALLALLLAGAGIYGVMAYLVAARTREIGVRMALGASRSAVLRLVVGRGLRLAAAGVVIGAAAALASGHWIANQLYQVKPSDPATLVAAGAVLLAASLAACYFPARRAASVDPNTALRVT